MVQFGFSLWVRGEPNTFTREHKMCFEVTQIRLKCNTKMNEITHISTITFPGQSLYSSVFLYGRGKSSLYYELMITWIGNAKNDLEKKSFFRDCEYVNVLQYKKYITFSGLYNILNMWCTDKQVWYNSKYLSDGLVSLAKVKAKGLVSDVEKHLPGCMSHWQIWMYFP